MTIKPEDCTPKLLDEKKSIHSEPSIAMKRFQEFCETIEVPDPDEAGRLLEPVLEEIRLKMLAEIAAEDDS